MSKNVLRLFVVRGGVSLLIRRLRMRQQLLPGSLAAAAWESAARWTATAMAATATTTAGMHGRGGGREDDGDEESSETLSPAKPYRSSRRYDGMG